MSISYVIGTGMHPHEGNQEQLSRWLWAIRRHASPIPDRIYLLAVGGAEPSHRNLEMARNFGLDLRVIRVGGNCGHIGQLLSGEKQNYFGGWSVGVITLAMIAYADEKDFIYVESDVISTGRWVDQLYADLGDGGMIFGGKMDRAPWMSCHQSLILIKHWYIPDFVGRYVGHGDERHVANLPENAFHEMREKDKRIRAMHWADDRMRPIRWDNPIISAQKWTPEELDELKRRGLL